MTALAEALGPAETVAAVLGVYLLAGIVKGAMGFGLPIVSVALLPFVVPVTQALTLNAIVLLATNIAQVWRAGDRRGGLAAAWPLMLGMALTVLPAAWAAAAIPREALLLVLGVFVMAFVGWSLAAPEIRIAPRAVRPVGVTTGMTAGVVGAVTSAPGAVFVAYVVALGLSRPAHMAALGYIMGLFGLMLTGSYAAVGLMRWEDVPLGLLSVPAAIAGMALGDGWAKGLGDTRFRRAVLALLAVLGLLLIRRALSS
ncbi:MAG: sulfite exporter TauE/SafE family protein [Pseudomonadota bacterium]